MAMNPATIMKVMAAKNKFQNAHPKFVAFFNALVRRGVDEGAVIEIKVTNPDGTEMVGNMRVTQEDLELLQELKNLQQ